MNKQAFLEALREALEGFPREDTEERLNFYSEAIDDRMEEGQTEESAVAALGDVRDIAAQMMEETPLTRLVKEKMTPRRTLRGWEIVLLVLGSPLWLSCVLTVAALVLSVYLVLWSLIVSLWIIEASLVFSALSFGFSAVVIACRGQLLTALALLGACMICAGVSVFLFDGCRLITKGLVLATKRVTAALKSLVMGKELAK